MNIISKFLGPWAIPNEIIPLNIVWDSDEIVEEITLLKPEILSIKEVFNADYLIENDSIVKFYNFESNGYFSAELISKEIDELKKECNIVLDFKRDNISIEKINLFTKILRPKLESIYVPDEIKIIEINGDFKLDNPIKLQYHGVGRIHVHASVKSTL